MANLVNTYAKGRFIEKALLPLGTDSLLVVLLQSSGLQVDNTLRNYQTLAAMLAANTEATFTNYARKSVNSGIVVTPLLTTPWSQTLDMADITWTAAGGTTNNTIGKGVICYRATSSATDSQIMPLITHDLSGTTTGTDFLFQISTVLATAS